MSNAQNNSTMELLAKDIKPGMVIKLDKYYGTVTKVEAIEKKNGGFRYYVQGLSIPRVIKSKRGRRFDKVTTGGFLLHANFLKETSKVTWKHI